MSNKYSLATSKHVTYTPDLRLPDNRAFGSLKLDVALQTVAELNGPVRIPGPTKVHKFSALPAPRDTPLPEPLLNDTLLLHFPYLLLT